MAISELSGEITTRIGSGGSRFSIDALLLTGKHELLQSHLMNV